MQEAIVTHTAKSLRHDKMHMGMVVDPPGVGMQYGGGGKFCRQVGVIATELSQGVDGRLE